MAANNSRNFQIVKATMNTQYTSHICWVKIKNFIQNTQTLLTHTWYLQDLRFQQVALKPFFMIYKPDIFGSYKVILTKVINFRQLKLSHLLQLFSTFCKLLLKLKVGRLLHQYNRNFFKFLTCFRICQNKLQKPICINCQVKIMNQKVELLCKNQRVKL
ncbi:hypothetical protein SS50377_26678 [Spironucleus salmonicida]|uniref:Uncharacterized protein n=1 Tax=Spironucleus salmonicida TaxID=348837 RepID=V6M6W3_9EUKA|nr:hypothetical protein SS50377_26678 [Spironucleus salmonicida]|eukprot:EST49154.1 Hypothetical protein SS50377_10367 [Spironucleus salmonicida]